jgi:hypothetical protein
VRVDAAVPERVGDPTRTILIHARQITQPGRPRGAAETGSVTASCSGMGGLSWDDRVAALGGCCHHGPFGFISILRL